MFASLGLVVWIWPFGPILDLFGPIFPKEAGGPNFLLAPQTLPTHRYSKLPLFLLVLFFPFLTWVKISMETYGILEYVVWKILKIFRRASDLSRKPV